MAPKAYLDTHVVVWLYAGRTSLLSRAASQVLNQDDLVVSPMVILEIDLLREIGRVYHPGEQMVQDLTNRIGLEVSDTSFSTVISVASSQSWTKDPFDRIIVGEASLLEATLITKDTLIHDHYEHAVW